MKWLTSLSVVLICACFAFTDSGKWVKHKYPECNFQIKLPDTWFHENIACGEDWPGMRCECGGVLFRDSDRGMKMVVYPTDSVGLDSPQRKGWQDCRFVPVEKSDTLDLHRQKFVRKKSNFANCVNPYDNSLEVRQLKSFDSPVPFVIYIFGKKEILESYEEELHEIVGCIKII